MKRTLINLVLIQAIFSGLFILGSLPFNSCEPDYNPDEENECDTCIRVLKPNIYIYPTERSILSVSLSFPLGGKVITSIPDYKDGWIINVDTNGIINNTYRYLFYESEQPDIWQTANGWIIKTADLEIFFKENMSKYGFNNREIEDFTDYWIPRLKDYDYYEIYPQEKTIIENVIIIEFTKIPDAVLRLFYLIKGTNNEFNDKIITPADIFQFKRTGFYVTEWGVVLK
jgi:hypothetical protein